MPCQGAVIAIRSMWKAKRGAVVDTAFLKIPRIHLSVIVDPDPRIHIWKKWIRVQSGSGTENLFFIFFMSDKLQFLFLLPQNLEKAFLR